MKISNTIAVIVLSAATSLGTIWGYNKLSGNSDTYQYQAKSNDTGKAPANYAGFTNANGDNTMVDFTPAASAAIPATVHIKTKANRTVSNNLPKRSPFGDMFDLDLDDLFGDRSRSLPQMASGSGAIISEDGYIVTNNHVIDGADEITVTLSNRRQRGRAPVARRRASFPVPALTARRARAPTDRTFGRAPVFLALIGRQIDGTTGIGRSSARARPPGSSWISDPVQDAPTSIACGWKRS